MSVIIPVNGSGSAPTFEQGPGQTCMEDGERQVKILDGELIPHTGKCVSLC